MFLVSYIIIHNISLDLKISA